MPLPATLFGQQTHWTVQKTPCAWRATLPLRLAAAGAHLSRALNSWRPIQVDLLFC